MMDIETKYKHLLRVMKFMASRTCSQRREVAAVALKDIGEDYPKYIDHLKADAPDPRSEMAKLVDGLATSEKV
jgi:hypothetical protein